MLATKRVEYRAWVAMKQRCYNPNTTGYSGYGGRGISVSASWRSSFAKFLEDVGPRPSKHHSLDRFPDNDGNYEPGNVRWATVAQQTSNKRPHPKMGPEGRYVQIGARMIARERDMALIVATQRGISFGELVRRAVRVSLGLEK